MSYVLEYLQGQRRAGSQVIPHPQSATTSLPRRHTLHDA